MAKSRSVCSCGKPVTCYSNPTLSTLRRYALAVEARLNFTVSSDRPYVLAETTGMAGIPTVVETSRSQVDWNARKVESRA